MGGEPLRKGEVEAEAPGTSSLGQDTPELLGPRPPGFLTSKGATLGKVTSMTSTPGRPCEVRTSPTCKATVPFTWQGTDTRDMVPASATRHNRRFPTSHYGAFPRPPTQPLELQFPGGSAPVESSQ